MNSNLFNNLKNKVAGITFKCGPSVDELQVLDVQEVETRFAGWIHTSLPRNKISFLLLTQFAFNHFFVSRRKL